jgi:TetR/AcrR family transcriptional regulator, fatty acid metabolism regulator protein
MSIHSLKEGGFLSRQRQDGKHQKILKAASKVFAQKGFHNTRVSEIAREAEVADGTIYLYFKNKDDILIHLFEETMEGILQGMREELRTLTDPVEKLRAFVRRHLRLVEENPDLADVIQVELRQSNKFMKDYDNRKFQEYLDLVAEIVREGQQKGAIRADVNPSIAKRVVYGALDELSTIWVLSRKRDRSAEQVAKQVSDIIISGLVQPTRETKACEALSNAQGGCHV